jgi:hypothetical protein
MKADDAYCDQCRKQKPLVWRGDAWHVPWKLEYADNRPDFQDDEFWFCSFECLRDWVSTRGGK